MVVKLSPIFVGQPQMSAQNFFDSRIVNSEVCGDSFQTIYASPIRGIGALVDHENSVHSSLAGMRSEESQSSSRSDLASVVEDDLKPQLL